MPVEMERHEGVALLTLNRPDVLNALSPDMLDDLEFLLDQIEKRSELRCVVITGAGDRAFTAGADIRHMREATPLQARDYARRGHDITGRIESFPKPVIAAVNGYALGGGCELSLACDIRLASERARFGLPEVNLGILPGWGGTQRMARATSPGFAKEMIFTGRQVDAPEAHAAGLVNHVHPHDELLAKALELAGEIATKPPWALAAAKEVVNLALDGDLSGHLARELDAFALAFTTEDQREGMAAFFEKRPARFQGR
ncbi:MAG TPA: enoyl-CoA hydratase-related protein [Miltoncostaeaceae bacterium]|nr:enoyl-CoA hydratase-related protein [Miltoncostaeaceae bacterium]